MYNEEEYKRLRKQADKLLRDLDKVNSEISEMSSDITMARVKLKNLAKSDMSISTKALSYAVVYNEYEGIIQKKENLIEKRLTIQSNYDKVCNKLESHNEMKSAYYLVPDEIKEHNGFSRHL